jgi:Flp pilus assembly protein TadG
MSAPTLRSLCRNDEGSALVEGAIVLPVLFALVAGVFEFSWLFYQQHLISTGVRDAARYIARSAEPNDATIQRAAKNLATTGAIAGNTSRVRGWSASDVSVTFVSVPNPPSFGGATGFRGGPVIQIVTVSTVFMVPSLGFFEFLGLKPPRFSVSHQERVVGSG